MSFAERLAGLPGADHIDRLELSGPQGQAEAIENRPGSAGSVRVYAYLAEKYGRIDAAAALEGMEIYAEHTEDARRHPGKHPNIDRLIAILGGSGPWQVRPVSREQ